MPNHFHLAVSRGIWWRRPSAQMETLDEWNVELVVVNSHDAGCADQLHAGIYRRIKVVPGVHW